MFSIRARVAACMCLLSASLCAAQTPADVRRDAQIHLGPLYVTPRFAMKELGVDTNVFNTADAHRDFTFTFTPAARVWVPFGRRALVTGSVASDVVYYQRYASERSINPDITVRTEFLLGHLEPFIEASYLRTRQRPNYEIDARSLREERGRGVGVRVRLSPRASMVLAAEQLELDFGADASYNDINLRETLNRTTTKPWLEGRYELTPLTTVSLRAERAADRFEFSPLRDADSFALIPGVEFKARALVSGSARVGFRRFTPLSDSLASFSGVVAHATLSYTLQGATKFTVSADRDLTYSYERVQPYFVTDGYGLTVRRQVAGPIDVSGAVMRQRYSYRDLLLPGTSPLDLHRVDTTRSWSGSLGYRIGDAMRAGVGALYRERESNSTRFREYQGLRFITTVDYEF